MFSSTKKPMKSKLEDTENVPDKKEPKKTAVTRHSSKNTFRPSTFRSESATGHLKRPAIPQSQTQTSISLARSTADCTGMHALENYRSPPVKQFNGARPDSHQLQSFFKNASSSSTLNLPNKPLVPLIELNDPFKVQARSKSAVNVGVKPKELPVPPKDAKERGKSQIHSGKPSQIPNSVTQLYPFKVVKQWEKQSGKLWSNLSHSERRRANMEMSEMLRQRQTIN